MQVIRLTESPQRVTVPIMFICSVPVFSSHYLLDVYGNEICYCDIELKTNTPYIIIVSNYEQMELSYINHRNKNVLIALGVW